MTLGVSYGLGTYYTKNRQDNQFIFVPILDLERAGLRIVKSF
jgi:hypothetical protein